jgi:PQQ-dependent catabolism-associated CXXCW motif protein
MTGRERPGRGRIVPYIRRRDCLGLGASFAVCHVAGAFAADEATLFDPQSGYRISRYRAPVPETVPGGTRIHFEDVERLVKDKGALLIDAAPAEGAGPDPETGEWRLTRKRENIPGSHWLADVGKGTLSASMDLYFKSNLDRLTRGDKSHPIIIYCLADCWMGWNAVKRAASYGYTSLFWYPEGTDGWRDWDGRFAPANPVRLENGGATDGINVHRNDMP